jgi:hypothetical protein
LVPESWGGDTIVVEMSAEQGLGIDDLLEQLLVVAELEELTANPTGRAKGIVSRPTSTPVGARWPRCSSTRARSRWATRSWPAPRGARSEP